MQAALSPTRHGKQKTIEPAMDSMAPDSNRNLRLEFLEKFVENDRPRRFAVASVAFEEHKKKSQQN